MNFKKAIIAYLPHKRMENTGNKKIIFFAIMKPLNGMLKTPNFEIRKYFKPHQ
ncbi:hypothetical protein [Helicobacter pylori]|uniref:hypothetical protein n=1 Tax=Helicobacter pylori TaxID=210 RepID=UPI0002EA373E|nr:hypothetical protein [Helicobacter pylori]